MYAYFKGHLIEASPSHVILEVNGIGYFITIPCSSYGKLPQIGNAIQLYTSYVVREFSHALYGFILKSERDLFETLLNITGVGPKLAISLIGHLEGSQLYQAVVQQDLPSLCKVPGVGKKTAERLVVELKDKLQHFSGAEPSLISIAMPLDPKNRQLQDAVQALVNLGYNQGSAQKAIRQSMKEIPEPIDLGELIRVALKNI